MHIKTDRAEADCFSRGLNDHLGTDKGLKWPKALRIINFFDLLSHKKRSRFMIKICCWWKLIIDTLHTIIRNIREITKI